LNSELLLVRTSFNVCLILLLCISRKQYAPKFERSLCVDLKYRTPQELERVLLSREDRSDADRASGMLSHSTCVDFGCGTGLMGVLLRPRCTGRLIGSDLSRGMLEVAERKHAGVYDQLEAADAVSHLRRQAAGSADLVVGADVCVYMRQLVDLVAAAAAALAVGGLLAFSTEACRLDEVEGGLPPTGEGWVERKSERIAHSEEYIRWLVGDAASPLKLVTLESSDIRNDGKKVIRGFLVLMQKVRDA
jgi:predicted TPR repeat methyltransferase